MSDEPDRERVRALIVELDKVQRESERLRAKIAETRRKRPEFPEERETSRLYGDVPDPSQKDRP